MGAANTHRFSNLAAGSEGVAALSVPETRAESKSVKGSIAEDAEWVEAGRKASSMLSKVPLLQSI